MINQLPDFGFTPSIYQQKIFDFVQHGTGNAGLTFWRPEGDEHFEGYEIVSYPSNPKHEEFKEKCFKPSDSIRLRII